MITKLLKLADQLDSKSLYQEANIIDHIITAGVLTEAQHRFWKNFLNQQWTSPIELRQRYNDLVEERWREFKTITGTKMSERDANILFNFINYLQDKRLKIDQIISFMRKTPNYRAQLDNFLTIIRFYTPTWF